MSIKYISDEQKEFFEDLSGKFNDTIESVEMICIDGDKNFLHSIGLSFPPGRKTLWAILAFASKGLHIYVNPTETTILGFKVGTPKKAPKEQLFSFSTTTEWNVEPILKNTLFGKRVDKYNLSLSIAYPSNEAGTVRGTLLLQTQNIAKKTLEKMLTYK